MEEALILILQIIAIAISLILLFVSFKWPNTGRFLFAMLFLWASYINTKTAISSPQDYLNYSEFAWLVCYRNFIDGFFSRHITLIVGLIACFQLLIGVLLTTKGKAVVWSGWAAIVFLLGIAPLGVGSGFPSTLIMALALFIIIRKPVDRNLWEVVTKNKSNQKASSKYSH